MLKDYYDLSVLFGESTFLLDVAFYIGCIYLVVLGNFMNTVMNNIDKSIDGIWNHDVDEVSRYKNGFVFYLVILGIIVWSVQGLYFKSVGLFMLSSVWLP